MNRAPILVSKLLPRSHRLSQTSLTIGSAMLFSSRRTCRRKRTRCTSRSTAPAPKTPSELCYYCSTACRRSDLLPSDTAATHLASCWRPARPRVPSPHR
eukprot:1009880-Prorocentrum_lima.AAC.1